MYVLAFSLVYSSVVYAEEYTSMRFSKYMRQEDAEDAQVLVFDLNKSGAEITNQIASLTDISSRRKAVVIKGLELLRYTKYNLGSKVSNTYLGKPSYLDCSGFVQWAILRATGYDIGHGTAAQYADSTPIKESELQIGDLGFRKPGGVQNLGGGNHVGIFVGYDAQGEKLWLHCTSGKQNGVNITRHSGLVYYARPKCY